MISATSCGGVVIYHGKILLLYKNFHNRYDGWVLPKGTVEEGESFQETAIREVQEETGAKAKIVKFIGDTKYTFTTPEDVIDKTVHWYLMMSDNFYSKPQKEEFFQDSGYYKFHEAKHLMKYPNERQILEEAYEMYLSIRDANLWGSKKYF